MTVNEFIFSDKIKHKLPRHVVFWILICLQFFYEDINVNVSNTVTFATYNLLVYILPVIIFVTVFAEVLMPKLLQRKKYISFSICAVAMIILNIIAVSLLAAFYMDNIFPIESGKPLNLAFRPHAIAIITANRVTTTSILAFTVCAFKFLKIVHTQQIENRKITKEKNERYMRLAKNKMQSFFLLNTLQTVHAKIDNKDFDSPKFILILSDVLSYTLHQAENNWVPLSGEIDTVLLLIELQNLSKKKNSAVLQMEGDVDNKLIQPLLLFNAIYQLLLTAGLQEQQELDFVIRLQINADKISMQSYKKMEIVDDNGFTQEFFDLKQVATEVNN